MAGRNKHSKKKSPNKRSNKNKNSHTSLEKVVHINDFPNEVLEKILKKIALRKLVRIRAVCARWNLVIISICKLKQSLRIFDITSIEPKGEWVHHNYKHYYRDFLPLEEIEQMKLQPAGKDDHLKMRAKKYFGTRAHSQFLGNLFPNVKQLTISKDIFFQKNLDFLSQWPHLHTLTLVTNELLGGFTPKFVEILNSKTELRCLDLLFYDPRSEKKLNVAPLAPTLARLERYSFKMHGDIEQILSFLNPNCKRLQIGKISEVETARDHVYFDENELENGIKANPQLPINVTHLTLTEFYNEYGAMLKYIFKTFINLQYLCINCLDDKHNVGRPKRLNDLLVKEISNLNHLEELRLLNICMELHYKNPNSKPKPANSLKTFYLSYSNYNYDDFKKGSQWCQTLATIFPNLERLLIESPNVKLPSIQKNLHYFTKLHEYKFIEDYVKEDDGEASSRSMLSYDSNSGDSDSELSHLSDDSEDDDDSDDDNSDIDSLDGYGQRHRSRLGLTEAFILALLKQENGLFK